MRYTNRRVLYLLTLLWHDNATGLVLQDEVIFVVNTGQCCPVDGIHVAQLRVFLYTHGATDDASQWHKTKILHVRHLIDHLQHDDTNRIIILTTSVSP